MEGQGKSSLKGEGLGNSLVHFTCTCEENVEHSALAQKLSMEMSLELAESEVSTGVRPD